MSEHTKNSRTDVPQMMTVSEVMDKLKISRMTLHRLTKDGKLKSSKVRRSIRYSFEDVNSFLETVLTEVVEVNPDISTQSKAIA